MVPPLAPAHFLRLRGPCSEWLTRRNLMMKNFKKLSPGLSVSTYFHCQLEERNFEHFVARIRTLCTFTKITFLGVFGTAEVDAKINDLVKNGDGVYGTFFYVFLPGLFFGFYVLALAFFRENIIWQWSHFSISFLFSKGSELGLPHDFLRTDQKLG